MIKQKSKEKEDSAEIGTDYEHQRANDYLTQQPRASNNFSIGTKTIASKPKKLNMSRNLLHHLGHLKELRRVAMSKKHTLLLNT
jgi:hypothetical protein